MYFHPFFRPNRDTRLPSSCALPCQVSLRFAALALPPRVSTVARMLCLVSDVESISRRSGCSVIIILRLLSVRFKLTELFFLLA
jgi:hypothetical protein